MASIIKADNIQKVSDGTNIIKKCGSTTTIGSGACSPIVICGSTVTLGRCGGTVTLACGATQTGFGRTGTVDWCTTAKTAPFTGVSGKGYFVNTSCGAVTVTLPATPTAGDIISVKDYAETFDNNAVTVARNGSKIGGECLDATLSDQGDSITLVYVDATQGWLNVQTDDTVKGNSFVAATGGTVTTCGDYKIHTFTGDGNFQVTNAGSPAGSTTVDYLVIAGGGAGGAHGGDGATVGGGGGAGGYRFSDGTASGCYSAGPAPLGASALPVSVQTYSITVGGGGVSSYPGTSSIVSSGNPSTFSTITSAGGGSGGGSLVASCKGNGGSGGGGNGVISVDTGGGTGNTPPVSPPQGFNGGNGDAPKRGGGGGGASQAGLPGSPFYPVRGKGGDGLASSITGSAVTKGGGGGGGNTNSTPNGGSGGGGTGPNSCSSGIGTAGTVNTGGGGGGGPHCNPSPTSNGGAGGSGVVIIRYKYQ
jgi:hypothetical protein